MRQSTPKKTSLLRWLAGMHSIHAMLVAIASLGAALPTARYTVAAASSHSLAQSTQTDQDPTDNQEDDRDRDRNQNQDRDADQDQDVSDLTRLFMANEQDDFFAPELIVTLRPALHLPGRHTTKKPAKPRAGAVLQNASLRPVYGRTCRLML